MNISDIDQKLRVRYKDITTCAPCMAFFIYLDHTEPEVILDFYHKAREALGPLITHIDTGKGAKKLNKRSETTVQGWCKGLKPWHSQKNYWALFSGVSEGVSDAKIEMQVLHRDLKFLSVIDKQHINAVRERKLKISKDTGSLPCTNFRITFPLEHPLAKPKAFKSWILSLKAISEWPFVFASAGLSFNYVDFDTNSSINHILMNHIPSIVRRHPGLEIQLSYNPFLLSSRSDWLEQHDYFLPLIGRCNWLTAVNNTYLQFISGYESVKTQLLEQHLVSIDSLSHGILVQVGDEPLLGDVEIPTTLQAYKQVSSILHAGRIPFYKLMTRIFLNAEITEEWWNALDNNIK